MLAHFWEAMHSLSTMHRREVRDHGELQLHTASSTSAAAPAPIDIELCRRHPNLRATVYDLPPVCKIAANKIASAGLGDRIGTPRATSSPTPHYPRGHDAMLLSLIMHDWTESEDRVIPASAPAHAFAAAGRDQRAAGQRRQDRPAARALMSLNMLVETAGGRNYTPAEYGTWLRDTGFVDVETVWFEAPGANGVVLARKPMTASYDWTSRFPPLLQPHRLRPPRPRPDAASHSAQLRSKERSRLGAWSGVMAGP